MLLPPLIDIPGREATIKVPPGNKHVAFGISEVWLVTLIQFFKCVPHVELHKIDLEVYPACRPPPTPLHRALNNILHIRKGKPVVMGLLWGRGGVLVPQPHTVLGMVARLKGPHGKLISALRTL